MGLDACEFARAGAGDVVQVSLVVILKQIIKTTRTGPNGTIPSMKMSKYYFHCPECGRTFTHTVPLKTRSFLLGAICPSTQQCGWGGRLSSKAAFKTTTVDVKPKLTIRGRKAI